MAARSLTEIRDEAARPPLHTHRTAPLCGDPIIDLVAAFWFLLRCDLEDGYLVVRRRASSRRSIARTWNRTCYGLAAFYFLCTEDFYTWCRLMPLELDPDQVRVSLLQSWPRDQPPPLMPRQDETASDYIARSLYSWQEAGHG